MGGSLANAAASSFPRSSSNGGSTVVHLQDCSGSFCRLQLLQTHALRIAPAMSSGSLRQRQQRSARQSEVPRMEWRRFPCHQACDGFDVVSTYLILTHPKEISTPSSI